MNGGINELFYKCIGKISMSKGTYCITNSESILPGINALAPGQVECKMCIAIGKYPGVMKFVPR